MMKYGIGVEPAEAGSSTGFNRLALLPDLWENERGFKSLRSINEAVRTSLKSVTGAGI
jgi:hypothetical protein